MSPGEVAELVENLKSCKDYLEMERLLSDSLRKDIIKLKIKINELMVELSITKEKLVYYENKEKSNNEP